MLSLIYVSSAVHPFSDADLMALLKQSREKNARLDITGLLAYQDGSFIQVLEGLDDGVRQLFKTICADNRHRGVIRLVEFDLKQRDFPDWTMAFRNLDDPDTRGIPGYSEFMNEPLDSGKYRTDPERARRLLGVFRRNIGR